MANSVKSTAATSNTRNSQDTYSVDFSSLVGNFDGDWQEKAFQKIKAMNAMYHSDLTDIHRRVSAKLLEEETRNGQIEKLRYFNTILGDLLVFVRTNKDDIQPSHNEKIAAVEKIIVNVIGSNKPCKAVMQPGQQASQNNVAGSNMYPGQGKGIKSIRQVAMDSLQQNGQMNMNFVLPELKMATSMGSSKRKRSTGSVDVELIPMIQRLAERSKNAANKDELEEIVSDFEEIVSDPSLDLNSSADKLIMHASWSITKHLSDYEDTKMTMVLKDDAEVFLAMKMHTWIRLVKLGRELERNLSKCFDHKLIIAAGVETDDWRTRLQPDSRQRIVNKIMDTLKRHLPFSGEEGLQELNNIAVRFEQKICDAATDKSDYLRTISMKLLTMETKSQNPNSLRFNAASNIKNSRDTGKKNPPWHQ